MGPVAPAARVGQPAAMSHALHAGIHLGFSFGGLWNDVKHGVESAVDDIAKEGISDATEMYTCHTQAFHTQ